MNCMLLCGVKSDEVFSYRVGNTLFAAFNFIVFFFPLDNRSSEVFASPDRQIRVIKFNKEAGKLLGEKSREQLLLF